MIRLISKIKKARVYLFFCVFILVLFIGCFRPKHIPLNKDIYSSIQSVTISKNIVAPRGRVVQENPGFSGLTAGLAAGRATELSEQIENVGILKHIPDILREQFINELKNSKLFNIIENNSDQEIKPDAEFVITISCFYFSQPQLFTRKRTTQLCVTAKLVFKPHFEDPDKHTLVWQKYEYTRIGMKLPAYTIETYINSPEKFDEAITKAAQLISKKLVEDMKQAGI